MESPRQTPGAQEGHRGRITGVSARYASRFDPVVVGGLARAKDFDVGTPVYTKLLTAAELRKALGLSGP